MRFCGKEEPKWHKAGEVGSKSHEMCSHMTLCYTFRLFPFVGRRKLEWIGGGFRDKIISVWEVEYKVDLHFDLQLLSLSLRHSQTTTVSGTITISGFSNWPNPSSIESN
jgi:hypothetical protein